jgi:hypothetical protein
MAGKAHESWPLWRIQNGHLGAFNLAGCQWITDRSPVGAADLYTGIAH